MRRPPLWDQSLHDVRRITAAGRRTECRAYHLWDGFDNYNGSSQVWSAVLGTLTYGSGFARFATPTGLLGQGLKFGGGTSWIQWNMVSNQPTMIFGFGIFIPQFPLVGASQFLRFMDVGTGQCGLEFNSSGSILLNQGFSGATLAITVPGVMTTGIWHWLDVVITINNTTGAIQVYLDQPAGGAPVLTGSGLNTRSTANNSMNQFAIGDFGNVFNGMQIDDFHAHDITGAAPNAILGDSRIYTKKANGAGFSTLWTPNGAAANWQCSDEAPPDGDTTYNASNTPGAIDGYAVPTVPLSVAPNGLVRRSYVRRDDAGPHTFQNGIRSGSSNGLGSAFTVPSTYAWTDNNTCYVNDPATGSPFTAAAADAVQMIIDETS
jgi:hypothetical protein